VKTAVSRLVERKQILVCAGAGGVGKTTVAAAIGVKAAAEGKKVAVLTIDPAKRLAASLGLKSLTNEPKKVNVRKFSAAGIEMNGELHAMMLDTKSTFDQVVARYAPSKQQAETILANRLYRNIAGALSGTQEYMAMEKLYELHTEGDYDLIVIDTPPTRNALDFLDAPKRMIDFFESRVLRWLILPYTRAGGGLFKVANVAATTFLKVVQRIVGSETLEDAAEFFGSLQGMYDGFKQRARQVASLLQSNATSFIVVTSPAADSVEEARFFAARLNESGLPFGGLVVNRVHPMIGDRIRVTPRSLARLERGGDDERLLSLLLDNYEAFMRVVELEEGNLGALARKVPSHNWVRVPFLEQEAVDFAGLWLVAEQLWGEKATA
jgi:anion-transporting  ArsA/GET3 family ATPase